MARGYRGSCKRMVALLQEDGASVARGWWLWAVVAAEKKESS